MDRNVGFWTGLERKGMKGSKRFKRDRITTFGIRFLVTITTSAQISLLGDFWDFILMGPNREAAYVSLKGIRSNVVHVIEITLLL